MKLSAQKKAERAALVDKLENLNKAANNNGTPRDFTDVEQREWDGTQTAIARLDPEIKTAVEREELERSGPTLRLIDGDGKEITVLKSSDKLADRYRNVPPGLRDEGSLGFAIKGLVTNQWDGRDALRRAMGEATLAGGGYTVPVELSAQWLDLARAASVCAQAGALTLPMSSQTLRVAGLATDVVPAFRAELTDFPISNNTFRAVDLRARTIGVISEASIELLMDSPNAATMIETSMLAAMGLAMDQALLSGDGVVVPPADNPLGILNWPGVGDIPAVGALDSYVAFLQAMAMIAAANQNPASVVMNPAQKYALAGLVTGIAGDKTQLLAPVEYSAMQNLVTTGIAAGKSIVGDFTKSGWGLREGITIEATRVGGDSLLKGKVMIRAYMRLDTAVFYPAAFTKLGGITAPTPPVALIAARR